LLSLLEAIKSKGKLIKSSNVGQLRKIAIWYTKVYENATLKWGKVGRKKPSEVLYFSLNFEKVKAR
jgi:hypothetical protein